MKYAKFIIVKEKNKERNLIEKKQDRSYNGSYLLL